MPKKSPRAKKSTLKYEEPIRLPSHAKPGQLLKAVFAGRPKPKDEWRYLKR